MFSGSSVVCLVLVASSWAADADDPIATSLCEILKNPEQFDGKIVRVRATVVLAFETSLLKDNGCGSNASVWASWEDDPTSPTPDVEYAYLKSRADLQNPASLRWNPVESYPRIKLKADSEAKKCGTYANLRFRPRHGKLCVDGCPSYSVTATFTGRLDFHDRLKAYRYPNDNRKVWSKESGFGHLGAWDERLVVESVSEVVVVKNDPELYQRKK